MCPLLTSYFADLKGGGGDGGGGGVDGGEAAKTEGDETTRAAGAFFCDPCTSALLLLCERVVDSKLSSERAEDRMSTEPARDE